MSVTVNPLHLSFPTWTNGVILEAGTLLPRAGDEQDWKAWAVQVALVDGTAPDPTLFDDWRTWGIAWVEAQ